jgi:hypothetical protein
MVSTRCIITHVRRCRNLCILHSPVELDPNSSNLDYSAKVDNIILRRDEIQSQNCVAYTLTAAGSVHTQDRGP